MGTSKLQKNKNKKVKWDDGKENLDTIRPKNDVSPRKKKNRRIQAKVFAYNKKKDRLSIFYIFLQNAIYPNSFITQNDTSFNEWFTFTVCTCWRLQVCTSQLQLSLLKLHSFFKLVLMSQSHTHLNCSYHDIQGEHLTDICVRETLHICPCAQ